MKTGVSHVHVVNIDRKFKRYTLKLNDLNLKVVMSLNGRKLQLFKLHRRACVIIFRLSFASKVSLSDLTNINPSVPRLDRRPSL